MLGRDIAKTFFQIGEKLLVVIKVTACVVGAFLEPLDQFGFGFRDELLQLVNDHLAKLFARHLLTPDADHSEFMGKEIVLGKIVESRKQLPFRQVAGRSKDHHYAGICLLRIVGHERYFATGECLEHNGYIRSF